MESKVTRLLYLRSQMYFCSYRRQAYIELDDFQMAMYYQFKFLDLGEEFSEIKNSVTSKESQDYIQAMLCWDYK